MPSSTLRMAGAERESRSARLVANMLAIGPSRRGAGCAGAPMRGARKFSSQATSGRSIKTWRSVQATPTSSTHRMMPFSTGLLAKALNRASDSSAVTASTASRKPSMRQR